MAHRSADPTPNVSSSTRRTRPPGFDIDPKSFLANQVDLAIEAHDTAEMACFRELTRYPTDQRMPMRYPRVVGICR
jgi:hypothetical protein